MVQAFRNYFERAERTSRILEVGAGDGFWLGFLQEMGFSELYGFEISEIMLAKCWEGGFAVSRQDICDATFEQPFDIVICADVLEHIPAVDRALDRGRRQTGE